MQREEGGCGLAREAIPASVRWFHRFTLARRGLVHSGSSRPPSGGLAL